MNYMSRWLVLSVLGTLLVGAGCNQLRSGDGPSTPPVPEADLSLITNFEFSCNESGRLAYESWGSRFPEPLTYFMEFRGSGTGLSGRTQVFAYIPNWESGRFGGVDMECTALPPEGELGFYLIFPNGAAARYWRRYTMLEGSDGWPTLTTSKLYRESVPVEALRAEQVFRSDGKSHLRLKETPVMPLNGLRIYCIQPTAPGWPYGYSNLLNNTSRSAILAPEQPPGLYVVIGAGNFMFRSVNYVNKSYMADGGSGGGFHSSVRLGLPADRSFHLVIYYRWTDFRYPEKRGRFGRVYTRLPITLRREGDRLVCQNTGEDNLVVEDMPGSFSFPNYDLHNEYFSRVPMVLPPELDPHAGR